MIRIGILTASDKGACGERQDLSGERIREAVASLGEVTVRAVVPDDRGLLAEKMREMADQDGVHLLLTTGGTGFSPRDVTPEATLDVVERRVPGIPEAMRAGSLQKTPMAMLSRAEAGIRGSTLIVNLPGSPRACRECLEILLPVLRHGLEILLQQASECARPEGSGDPLPGGREK